MSARHYAIVGAGVAGIEAAAAVRAADAEGRITVLTDEDWPYYSRIRIGEVVDGRVQPDQLALRMPGWYGEQRIDLRRGARVEGVDVSARRLRLAGGEALPYDALLLATGARPFVPPFPGADLPAVRTLRRMDDAIALRDAIPGRRRAVVIGGGLLGLELAASLAGAGLAVTVVEVADRLLPRQLDPEGGALVRELLERRGIAFALSATVGQVRAAGDGAVVDLADGRALDADLVLASAGVRPVVDLARNAGAAIGKGIVVDDRLATSLPGVYAAGDCAEHRGELYGIWPASGEQGKAAGRAMAGADVAYAGTVRSTTLKVSDIGVFAMGRTGDADGAVTAERTGDDYRRLVRDGDGRLVGAALVGNLAERRAIVVAMTTGRPYPGT
ncbi:MAG TPA: FAD-dependent oxidoreductase [Myxococcota bacterium]|nr:FAD-dependent oxidoreductase [Myxococcota bacterium]